MTEDQEIKPRDEPNGPPPLPWERSISELRAERDAALAEVAELRSRLAQPSDMPAEDPATASHRAIMLRLGAAMVASPQGVGIWGLDDRFVFINDSLAKMHGYAPDELLGAPWRQLSPPHRSSELDAAIGQALRDPERRRWDGELEGMRRDGSRFPVEVQLSSLPGAGGAHAGAICIVRDITQRRAFDAELVRLRTAVEASGEAIFLTDREGVITYVNPQFTRLYGWTPSEVVGLVTPRILKSGRLSAERYDTFWATIVAKQVVRIEIINRAKDGREVWIDASANPILDEAGEIVGYLAIQRDITERRRLAEQLVQAQKMEAVGRLAGGIAHDYNNILSVIMGYSDLLLAELDSADPIRGDVDEIHRAAGRAAALTRQLLVFSRREVSRPEVVDINAVVAGVDRLLRRAVGEDVALHLEMDPTLPYVHIDSSHVEQMLMNLVVNARDATHGGGRIAIVTSHQDLTAVEAERLGLAADGRYVVLEVNDTGHGMGPDVAARAFDPFFSTKPKGLGTGLGLSIVYAIVKHAEGAVTIESEPDRGTCARIYLRATTEERPARDGAVAPAGAAARRETILLVEDEDQVRALSHRMLLQRGYRVIEARNAGEAILLAEQGDDHIDLLLTDVVMPQFSGTRLALRLTKLLPHLRVLFMSGYSDAVDRETIMQMGADLVIKPFNRNELLDAVDRALSI